MDTTTIVKKENADSINLKKTAKGDITWDVKAYGDVTTGEGLTMLENKIKDLKGLAIELSKQDAVE